MSAISPLYLRYISATSPLHLPCISQVLRLSREAFLDLCGSLSDLVHDNFKRKVIEGIVIDDTPIFSKLLHEEQVRGDVWEI